MSVLRFHYRKMFGLSAREMEEEPVDEFFTNLYINGQMNEKERLDMKHAGKK